MNLEAGLHRDTRGQREEKMHDCCARVRAGAEEKKRIIPKAVLLLEVGGGRLSTYFRR